MDQTGFRHREAMNSGLEAFLVDPDDSVVFLNRLCQGAASEGSHQVTTNASSDHDLDPKDGASSHQPTRVAPVDLRPTQRVGGWNYCMPTHS